MESQQPSAPSKLVQLPNELLINILSFTNSAKDAYNLARTCKTLYYPLITDIMVKAGTESNWSPLFEAIRDDDFPSFERWLDLTPVDHHSYKYSLRPLRMAIMYHRPAMVKSLLSHGANPNFIKTDAFSGIRPSNMDWLSPLHHTLKATLAPFPPFWSVPGVCIQWKQKRAGIPEPWELQATGRQIIKALRLAGADESALGAKEIYPGADKVSSAQLRDFLRVNKSALGVREREHLDAIEAGESCCGRHKVFKKPF